MPTMPHIPNKLRTAFEQFLAQEKHHAFQSCFPHQSSRRDYHSQRRMREHLQFSRPINHPESIIALATELIRIGTTLRLHPDSPVIALPSQHKQLAILSAGASYADISKTNGAIAQELKEPLVTHEGLYQQHLSILSKHC